MGESNRNRNFDIYLSKKMVEDVLLECGAERCPGETVPPALFHRMEKDDPVLHDIVVGKTTVTSPKNGKRTDVGFERVEGYWVYTIRWGRKATADGKYSTLNVLTEADEGTATSLEETYRSMIHYMCVMLNLVNIDVHETVKDDADQKVDKHQFVTLEGEDLSRAQKVRKIAWDLGSHTEHESRRSTHSTGLASFGG